MKKLALIAAALLTLTTVAALALQASAPPLRPVLLAPLPFTYSPGGVNVSGDSNPYSRITVTVTDSASSIYVASADSDGDGHWKTLIDPPEPLPVGQYTVSATDGRTTDTATLTVNSREKRQYADILSVVEQVREDSKLVYSYLDHASSAAQHMKTRITEGDTSYEEAMKLAASGDAHASLEALREALGSYGEALYLNEAMLSSRKPSGDAMKVLEIYGAIKRQKDAGTENPAPAQPGNPFTRIEEAVKLISSSRRLLEVGDSEGAYALMKGIRGALDSARESTITISSSITLAKLHEPWVQARNELMLLSQAVEARTVNPVAKARMLETLEGANEKLEVILWIESVARGSLPPP